MTDSKTRGKMARNNEFKTDQEGFWAGEFGEKYIDRNRGREIIASNISLFSKVFARATGTVKFFV